MTGCLLGLETCAGACICGAGVVGFGYRRLVASGVWREGTGIECAAWPLSIYSPPFTASIDLQSFFRVAQQKIQPIYRTLFYAPAKPGNGLCQELQSSS